MRLGQGYFLLFLLLQFSHKNDAQSSESAASGSSNSGGSSSGAPSGGADGVDMLTGVEKMWKDQTFGKKVLQMGTTFVLEEPGWPPLDTFYSQATKGVFHVPAPLPPLITWRFAGRGPKIPVSNYYPYHAYLPAYRSTYFYSPWMHDPFGLRPFNHYERPVREHRLEPPFNTYLYPWHLPSLPLVGAAKAAQWGYPGYYPGVPSVRGFPGGGMVGVPHPAYPFLTPVSRTIYGVDGLYNHENGKHHEGAADSSESSQTAASSTSASSSGS